MKEFLSVATPILVSIFIICFCLLILLWCLPGDVLRRRFHDHFISRFIVWCGLDTYWALFSPQPVSKNFMIGFEVELKDGTLIPVNLPEFEIINEAQKIRHYRFIKLHNFLLSQNDPIPREAICRYFAKQFQKSNPRGNELAMVHINRFFEAAEISGMLELPWLSKRIYTLKF